MRFKTTPTKIVFDETNKHEKFFDFGIIPDREKAFAEFKNRLSSQYGIDIIADSTKMARVITFKE